MSRVFLSKNTQKIFACGATDLNHPKNFRLRRFSLLKNTPPPIPNPPGIGGGGILNRGGILKSNTPDSSQHSENDYDLYHGQI